MHMHTSTTISRQAISYAAQLTGLDTQDIHTTYTPRNRGNVRCLAFTVPADANLRMLAADLLMAHTQFDLSEGERVDVLAHTLFARQDITGYHTEPSRTGNPDKLVLYFPKVTAGR